MGTCPSSVGNKIKEIVHAVSDIPQKAEDLENNNLKDNMTVLKAIPVDTTSSKPIDRQILQEYIQLEKSIINLERKNVSKKYDTKITIADELRRNLDQIEASYQEIRKQADIKHSDLQNLNEGSMRELFIHEGSWERRLEKEQRDYDEALKQQQSTEKELENKREQYKRAAKVADILKQKLETLRLLYLRQDVIFGEIFGAENMPLREAHLRDQLAEVLEWQQRIALAKFKWASSRLLLVHAVTQMAFGISRWKLVEHIEQTNIRARYFAASEARNNFNAASQNVASCRVYLGNVKFPYATEEEMALLDAVAQSLHQDIQSNLSLRKALATYETTYRKVASLLQWFDKVINDTILKDLDKAKNDVAKYRRQLREERLERLRQKVRHDLGEELVIGVEETTHSDENLTDEEILAVEQNNEETNANQTHALDNLTAAQIVEVEEISGNGMILYGDIKKTLLRNANLRQKTRELHNEVRSRLSLSLQTKLRQRLEEARKRTATVVLAGNKRQIGADSNQLEDIAEETGRDSECSILETDENDM